jgi:SAM-dependent methyltransferase
MVRGATVPSGVDSVVDLLQRLEWRSDRMLYDDLVFRLEHYRSPTWELGEDASFRFYKIKPLVDQYAAFWALRPSFSPRHVLELGIWYGGSAAFWFEMLRPNKLVTVDYSPRRELPYFDRYVEGRGLKNRLRTHWNFDQADQPRLRRLVDEEFAAPVDLVLDDASHLSEPTTASFEALFPRLRPGGLYIIEDWAWGHWPEFHDPDSPYRTLREPTPLLWELTEAAGTSAEVIASLTILRGFVAIERGPAPLTDHFALRNHIVRRPRDWRRSVARLRTRLARWRRHLQRL